MKDNVWKQEKLHCGQKIIVKNLWKHFSKENNMCCSDSYLNANASCNFQIPAIFYLPDIYCYDWVGKSLLLSVVHHNYVATQEVSFCETILKMWRSPPHKQSRVWHRCNYLCLLWPAADSNNLFNKLLLLQLDRFLHSDLTEGVHRVFHAISHHACIVRLHANLKRKTAGQSLQERWMNNTQMWKKSSEL